MAESTRRPDLVLFDLDGTLIQSRTAAWEFFADIAARYDLPLRSAEDFHAVFAGNFSEGLRAACPDDTTFDRVKREYFARLERAYAPPLVPGMREVVTHLAERTTLGVVSSNVMKVVRRALETNGIATCIGHVFTGDINPSKSAVIHKLRANPDFTLGRHCAPWYDESQHSRSDSTSSIYLVTDTVGDVEEARSAGATPVGVAWGMHTEEALRRAGAEEVVLWPQELVALLGQGPVLGTCDMPPPGNDGGVPSPTGGPLVAATSRPGARGGCRCGGDRSTEPVDDVLARVRAANRSISGTCGGTGDGSCAGSCAGTGSTGSCPGTGWAHPDADRERGRGTPSRASSSGPDTTGTVRSRARIDPEVRAALLRTGRR